MPQGANDELEKPKSAEELQQQIIKFLTTLPNLHDRGMQQALLVNAGLDPELQSQIQADGAPPIQFVTGLVSTLIRYGKLQDGRDALTAVLEAAKQYVGTEKQAYCDRLLQVLQEFTSLFVTQAGVLSEAELRQAFCQFLKAIENEFKYVPIFHPPHKIVLQDQYIPIEVTLERRYRHEVETTWSYAEGEAEFARAYAMKGSDEIREETRRVQVPWQEAKQKHKRLIVLADPGMGKTALLKMEAVRTAKKALPDGEKSNEPVTRVTLSGVEGEVEVPLFFRLSDFATADEEIADAIPRLAQRNYPDAAPAVLPLLAEKLKNGTCLLLLDALDEVPKEQRNPLADKLNRFARNYPCPIIVTSRIVGYGGGILHDAKEVEIVPFSRKQTKEYIETWFKNITSPPAPLLQGEGSLTSPPAPLTSPPPPLLQGEGLSEERSAKGLIRELRQKPQIRGLTQNPLLLSLLCSLYQEGELTLPARRVEIYKQAVEYMLQEWTRNRKPQSEGRIRAKLRLLEELAYRFSCEYKEIFTADDLYDKIEAYLHSATISSVFKQFDSDALITELTEEDGIIQKLEWEGDRYLFLHRTFQEYLTASYLKRQPNGIELAKTHFWDFDWHETLILFAGLVDDPGFFLNNLLTERDDIFHTLLLLAGKCLAECPQLNMPQLVERLYKLWRRPLYRKFFEPTVVAVGQTHQQMLTYLLGTLHDRAWDVRQAAAEALGTIGDTRAVEDLLAELHNQHEYFGVRRAAAEALGTIGDARAVGGLLTALQDADEDVRRLVTEALGVIGDVRAVEGLLTMLQDPSDTVREWATVALGQIGDARAVDGLLATLQDADEDVRSQATEALGEINDARAMDGLLAMLYDRDSGVRYKAVKALKQIGDARAVDGLLTALQDADEDVRWQAAWALKGIGGVQTVEGLLTMLYDQDYGIRLWAALVLGMSGDLVVIESLLNALNDTNEDIRTLAAEALGNIGDVQAVDGLLAVLHDPDRHVRRVVALSLGAISDARAVDALLITLHDGDEYVRGGAAAALGMIGDARAMEGLLAALHDTNEYVKVLAAQALGRIGDARAVDGLLAALHDIDWNVRDIGWNVREQAAKALGKIGTLEVLEQLLHRLDIDIYDKEIFPVVRRLAITFSRLHPPPACLPVYPQPLFLRLFKKGFWWTRLLWSFFLNELNKLRQKRR